jgi:hypothetical protein
VESAIQSGTLSQLATALQGELARLSATDCSSQVVLQLKKQGLIIDLMHQCDVAEQLAALQPSKASDWEWSRQLRFYGSQASAAACGTKGVAESRLPKQVATSNLKASLDGCMECNAVF